MTVLVEIGGGEMYPRLVGGDEYGPRLAALEQARQEPGGAGLPDDDVDLAALAADSGAAAGQVQVLDVERKARSTHASGPSSLALLALIG